ncbi:MAG: prepilin-type N-terminal cleavage/methylation domain-containing protein [Planctomycetes bacterium]|nr:prepilin-type N-terminal cleavage/methylation domain-containing protein [Planctomycetota bacterium]
MSMTDGHLSDGRRIRAFTLVEVIVVLSVIGVLAAISMPGYAEFNTHRRIRLVARKIVADLVYAQHLARLNGAKQSVLLDVSSDRYELIGVRCRLVSYESASPDGAKLTLPVTRNS